MNYHSVGKELGENPEAKIMFSEQSPTSAFRQNGPKKQIRRKKKKILGRGQNLKVHWPLP